MSRPRRVPDALMYRYTSSGVLAHTVVMGWDTIRAFQAQGWTVLITDRDVRFSDLETVRELDIARFQEWKDSYL